mgnify:CR=1 FL=1
MKQPTTIEELICWSYANLAMAHSAISQGATRYSRINLMIRARLYKGLISKTMNMGSLIDDEKVKLKAGCHCAYCGTTEQLSIDHLIPQIKGGANSADNSVFACRRCNSSKGSSDLFEWYNKRQCFPPLLIIRRYLKIVYLYCEANNLLGQQLEDVDRNTLPFRLDLIPTEYPEPSKLSLQ